ncbi:MAG: hypothetical protein Q9227_007717 [Pyrenula ochraceoflavens]
MHAVVIEKRGGSENLESRNVPDPPSPEEYDILVEVKACSVNPVDLKVRAGTYDDYPDYYDRVPSPYQILGFDGSGIVKKAGPKVSHLSPGTAVYYSGSPIRQGSNASLQLVDSRSVAVKPHNLDFAEAATVPLTYITAYEALIERMEVQKGEEAALLIVNGAGGVGAMATQIATKLLGLKNVITTASREETQSFCKAMGSTDTVNHREDVRQQIKDLKLKVPLKYFLLLPGPYRYIFICSRTSTYLPIAADLASPFGKICSIVQDKNIQMYGTPAMAKSLSFHWALLGTKPYYAIQPTSHGAILEEARKLFEDGTLKCTLRQRVSATLQGLKDGHAIVESGKSIGKVGVEVDLEKEEWR